MQKLNCCCVPPASPPALEPGRRAGGILVLVMAIVLGLALLGAALLSMGDLNGAELVKGQQATQAFCLAEGGLYHAVARLGDTNDTYRSTLTNFTVSLGAGKYMVSNVYLGGNNFLVTSRARVQNVYRTLQQTVQMTNSWPNPGAVLVSGGKITLSGTSNTINGDVVAGDNVSLNKTAVNGNIIADGNVTLTSGTISGGTVQVTSGNTVTPSSLPQSPPTNPLPGLTDWSAKKAYFDSQIAYAAAHGITLPKNPFPMYLNGTNLYVKGSVHQPYTTDAATPAIYGPGMLVASVDMKNLYKINGTTNAVTTFLAGGKIQLGTGGSPDSFPITNCTFYQAYSSGTTSGKDFWLDCPDLQLDNCILFCAGNIAARQFDMSNANSAFMSLGSILLGDNTAGRIFNIEGRMEAAVAITTDSKTSVKFTAGNLRTESGMQQASSVQSQGWVDKGSAPW